MKQSVFLELGTFDLSYDV